MNAIVTEVYTVCGHPYESYWRAAVYAYTGLLLAFGTFLAWETRTVTVPELNDSRYIGACIYNVVVVCMFGVPMIHMLPTDKVTTKFALESTIVILCTAVCQCIIFVPKIKQWHRVQPRFLTPQLPSCKIQTVTTTGSIKDECSDKWTDGSYEATAPEQKKKLPSPSVG